MSSSILSQNLIIYKQKSLNHQSSVLVKQSDDRGSVPIAETLSRCLLGTLWVPVLFVRAEAERLLAE